MVATRLISNVDIIKSTANWAAFPTQTLGNKTEYPVRLTFSSSSNVFCQKIQTFDLVKNKYEKINSKKEYFLNQKFKFTCILL